MKRFTLISIMLLVSVAMFARVDNYRVNDDAVDALFENATEITSPVMGDVNSFDFANTADFSLTNAKDKDPLIAFLISLTPYFVGLTVGIHRLYLGTEILTYIAYFCTGGGCGIVQFVDSIVLLMGMLDDDIGKYIDNPKFFMWLD